jgi:hypothetical protein
MAKKVDKTVLAWREVNLEVGLYHPLDGIINPKYEFHQRGFLSPRLFNEFRVFCYLPPAHYGKATLSCLILLHGKKMLTKQR